jgi:hypothetical protein
VLQRIGGGVVGGKFAIEVAKNCNANGLAHGSIVLERIEAGWVQIV